jgi:hypothetical protein
MTYAELWCTVSRNLSDAGDYDELRLALWDYVERNENNDGPNPAAQHVLEGLALLVYEGDNDDGECRSIVGQELLNLVTP